MIDVHAHFAEEGYAFPEEWDKILSAGVSRVILASDTVAHSRIHRDFCNSHEGAYFCAGVHPSDTSGFNEEQLSELEALCDDVHCVAVGEIGLDYHYLDTDKAAQRTAFIKQLQLANQKSLPVQIHSRDCAADMLAILTEMKAYLTHGFLLHCYSHGKEMMDDFLNLGAYFSFGGVTCFKNSRRVEESAAFCPLDRMLSETDSPYLSPMRGEKNTPANIPVIVEKLAALKNITAAQMEERILINAKRLFPKLK